MEANFWHERWEKHQIGFHLPEANPLLVKHVDQLNLAKGARVFVPMCGKTRDLAWLLSRGQRVAGAELSEIAVRELFDELDVRPTVSKAGPLARYHAPDIDVFVGNLFDLTADLLGPVDAVYDRAALVALPPDMRKRYAAHLVEITRAAPQLLICYEYDQPLMDGPPFSVPADEVAMHYRATYQVRLVERIQVAGGFRGKIPASEAVWLLEK